VERSGEIALDRDVGVAEVAGFVAAQCGRNWLRVGVE
jgi:hypothetical protein